MQLGLQAHVDLLDSLRSKQTEVRDMPLWLQIIVVASTLAGLGFAAFGMWVGYKEKQVETSASLNELKDTVAKQQKMLEAAEQRFRNLETIVTSQVWDVVHDDQLPEAEKQKSLSQARVELDDVPDEEADADQVARLANRLKG